MGWGRLEMRRWFWQIQIDGLQEQGRQIGRDEAGRSGGMGQASGRWEILRGIKMGVVIRRE